MRCFALVLGPLLVRGGRDLGADPLAALGINGTTTHAGLAALRASLSAWGVGDLLPTLGVKKFERAKHALSAMAACAAAEASADCVTLALPCAPIFGEFLHYGGGSGCPAFLRPSLAPAQAAVVAGYALGAETFFQWGGGGGAELLASLASRGYTAEHYAPWCECLRRRPFLGCLDGARPLAAPRVACTPHRLSLKAFGRLERDEGKTYPKKLTEAHLQYVSAIDATGETSFDVVLIDGRAHASAAIKAAGYATASTVVLVNDWPKKFETLVKRFYTLVATVGASGRECDKGERACLAVLTVKGKYAGDKATHDRHVERFKNFMRSPVNF